MAENKGPQESSAAASASPSERITPVDVQQKQFRLAFRGYHEREVDEFLDRVTEELARLHAENRRLQEEVAFRRTEPLSQASDLADQSPDRAGEEAASLVAEARARAAAIIEQARLAAGAVSPAGPGWRAEEQGSPDAVRRFLAREKDFLQRMAALIQGHAEAVKGDVRRARESAASRAAEPGAPPEATGGGEMAGAAGVVTAATAAEASATGAAADEEAWSVAQARGEAEETLAGPMPAEDQASSATAEAPALSGVAPVEAPEPEAAPPEPPEEAPEPEAAPPEPPEEAPEPEAAPSEPPEEAPEPEAAPPEPPEPEAEPPEPEAEPAMRQADTAPWEPYPEPEEPEESPGPAEAAAGEGPPGAGSAEASWPGPWEVPTQAPEPEPTEVEPEPAPTEVEPEPEPFKQPTLAGEPEAESEGTWPPVGDETGWTGPSGKGEREERGPGARSETAPTSEADTEPQVEDASLRELFWGEE